MRHLLFLNRYKFAILIAAVIFYASILKPAQLPSDISLFAGVDKIVHFLMYFILALALNFESGKIIRHNKLLLYCVVLVFPILYGGLIEILQANFFPPRTGEWLDFFANTAGVLFAYFIYHKILKNRLK